MNPLGHYGPVSLALVLTVILLVGIPGGGKLKALGWWTTLLVAMLAASAYRAAGGPFKIVPDMVGSLIQYANAVLPGITMPALATCVLAFILWKKLTTKQVAIIALIFFYVASSAGGFWSYFSDAIENARAGMQ
jgi:hypothetical protein